MSTTPLTDIQEIVERSLFERIRQELIDKGYLPDVTIYSDDAAGWVSYKAAIDAIVISKGYSVELFNTGIADSRGTKKLPRIVINCGSFLPGSLGGDPRRFFEDQGADYKALVTPPQTVDYYVDFHLVAGSIEQIRLMNSLLSVAVPRRGYIAFWNDSTTSFFARNIGYYDADNDDEAIIEKVFGYEIPDCWDAGYIEAYASIAKMSEITLNTNIQKYMDRTWGHDADPLVVT